MASPHEGLDAPFANWDPTFRLALGNELDGGRPWLGELYRVALYDCALTGASVAQHFTAPPAAALNQSPTASFTVQPGSDAVTLTRRFDASGAQDRDGTLQSYDWDLGDGTTATGVTMNHLYGALGSYRVTLTVTDNGGATATNTQTVTVGTVPNAPAITTQPAALTVMVGAPANFTVVAARQPLQYQWQRNECPAQRPQLISCRRLVPVIMAHSFPVRSAITRVAPSVIGFNCW